MRKSGCPRVIGWVLVAAGIGMLLYGFSRGEAEIVFTKAVNICLECIGIG